MTLRPFLCGALLVASLAGCASDTAFVTPAISSPSATSPSASPIASPTSGTGWDFYLGDGGQSGVAYRAALAAGDDDEAALLSRIALTPQAGWFGAWTPAATVEGQVAALVDAAEAQGKPAVFALYAIPSLDCSFFADGGLEVDTYLAWITAVATAIDGREPWVVLEPDALGQMGDCEGQGDRAGLLAQAAEILDDAGARVYLDSGNAEWLSVDEAARRIMLVGTDHLAGFSLNVSNYVATAVTRTYADQVAALTGLHYVIDTSRNGNGWNGEWCNAPGRALGETPRIVNEGYLDAYLWVKRPGESDGPCQGGPAAGSWWQEYALELASNAAANEG